MREFINSNNDVGSEYFMGYMAGYIAAISNLEKNNGNSNSSNSYSRCENSVDELRETLGNKYKMSPCEIENIINYVKVTDGPYDCQYTVDCSHYNIICNGRQFNGDAELFSITCCGDGKIYARDFDLLYSTTKFFDVVADKTGLSIYFYNGKMKTLGAFKSYQSVASGHSTGIGSWS